MGGGFLSLAAGIVGIALPLLPTTPFLLLAAFCFARGSQRLHDWLVHHPRLGPPIHDWQKHGAISRRAKQLAMLSIAAVLLVSYLFDAPTRIIIIQLIVLSAVSLFILTRPTPPEDDGQS
ncbi:MAG: YbaN family protein [Alphaproteobacteria bacterium]|nr:YbaN family protein [Alphaproteobacteria bacterium]